MDVGCLRGRCSPLLLLRDEIDFEHALFTESCLLDVDLPKFLKRIFVNANDLSVRMLVAEFVLLETGLRFMLNSTHKI